MCPTLCVHCSFTGKGIKVGIIDTGIDYNHEDLRCWRNLRAYRCQ
ncbi:S8 family serine peptidase [Tepidibacillus marianensis]